MKKHFLHFTRTSFLLSLVTLTTACYSQSAKIKQANGQPDLLEIIYDIADHKEMKVITDVNMSGGAKFGNIEALAMADSMRNYIFKYNKIYGHHQSFYGWYLNHEINPIKNSEIAQSNFWRTVWKAAADASHQAKPGSIVTVSPFFLSDKNSVRGFEYLQPSEYEKWWGETLKFTGIDILMLQDSGAEHLGFLTLEERIPFFEAFRAACNFAGTKFWLNVESGQVAAQNWDHALEMEKTRTKNWEFTPVNWLEKKLLLAAEYGEGIVNWGYFPLMNPIKETGPWPSSEIDDQEISFEGQLNAYRSYKSYYKNVSNTKTDPKKTKPLIRGTLWMLRDFYQGWSEKDIRKSITAQIDAQKAIGFDILWIINTPEHFKK